MLRAAVGVCLYTQAHFMSHENDKHNFEVAWNEGEDFFGSYRSDLCSLQLFGGRAPYDAGNVSCTLSSCDNIF